LPAAISGICAAYILGISRAVGERWCGDRSYFLTTLNPMDEAATITATIVSVSLGDLPHGS